MKLVVALGNPGREYAETRHNIAWMLQDKITASFNLSWREKFKGKYALAELDGLKVAFLKPLTYMNLSGESVNALIKFYKIKVEDILVLHDEIELSFGSLIFKDGGGLAGHNGLKSIAQVLGAQSFKRLRMGIGRPVHGSVSSWVLSAFDEMQDAELEDMFDVAEKAVMSFLEKDISFVIKKYNRKK